MDRPHENKGADQAARHQFGGSARNARGRDDHRPVVMGQETSWPAQRAMRLRRHRVRRYSRYLTRTHRTIRTHRAAAIMRIAGLTAAVSCLLVLSVVVASLASVATYYRNESALLAGLKQSVTNQNSLRIFDSKGTLLYEMRTNGAQHSIPLAQIPVDVINATVAIEDHDFWINQGVDFVSIVRAAQANLQSGNIQQGGSTITQQLIKQQLLGGDVTFARKLREAILAVGVTATGQYTKSDIMQLYLNSIPYSATAYGIEAAATEYFGYSSDPASGMSAAQHLNLAQASMLAGIPQNPNANNPLLHFEQARARQAAVLQALVRYKYITPQQSQAAWQEAGQPGFFRPDASQRIKAPHFVHYVVNELEQMVDSHQLSLLPRSGLNVYTTLDLDLQNHVQQKMKDHLYGTDRGGYPPYRLIRDSNVTNAAALLVDHRDGAIKVMLGSIDYYSTRISGNFNVVTQGFRGPGSSFKPIVYAAAFEKGWFPALTVADVPTVFWNSPANTAYKPLDFNPREFRGEVTLRHALQDSLNIPAVKVMQYVGTEDAKALAMRMGITEWADGSTWGLSSVLGSLDVTLAEMVQAYTVFANYGAFVPLRAIDRIVDGTNHTLYAFSSGPTKQVLDPRIAYMVSSVLSDNAARQDDFGPCSPLYLAPDLKGDCDYIRTHNFTSPRAWPAASKTGTGQNFSDDWTIGYTMDYTMGVWVGNNDHSPMLGIDGITGSAPIWHNSMVYAEQQAKRAPTAFPVPEGMQKARYCSNGICTTDWFLAGALPPANLGEQAPANLPCIVLDPRGGWNYSSPPNCQGYLRP